MGPWEVEEKVMNRSSAPEGGFTLIELLVGIGMISILVTLGAFAAREFWFQRALLGSHDEIVNQLRATQLRAVSEGVSGRYHGAWFDPDTSDWGTVSYQSGTCTSTGAYTLPGGVEVDSVTVGTTAAEVNFASPTDIAATCRTQLSQVPNGSDVTFVWFLARGVATETSGSHIQIIQPRRDNRTKQIRVLGLTARVEKV